MAAAVGTQCTPKSVTITSVAFSNVCSSAATPVCTSTATAVISMTLASDDQAKAKTTATALKDTGLKAAKTNIKYDNDVSTGTPPTATTRLINFVDKITYPTTSSFENEKPWSNAESLVSGKATGRVDVDYTLFSDNSLVVDFTLTYTMSGSNVLEPANEAKLRICTSPFSNDGTNASLKSRCAQTSWLIDTANARVKAGQFSGAQLADAIL